MTDKDKRPGLRERVAMRKRGLDPDAPRGRKKKNHTLKLIGLTLQLLSVFALLGYIVYYTQGVSVALRPALLVVLCAVFVTGRVITYLGGSRSGFKF
ncbi:MAG: hypothetical protein AAF221_15375 [Pseudomonadota bacterium]